VTGLAVKVAHGHRGDTREEEYLLVLDFYFSNRERTFHKGSQEVIDLANLTRRTPAAIVMRLANFASIDTETQSARGLANYPEECRRYFHEWKDERSALAVAVRKSFRPTLDKERQLLFPTWRPLLAKYELQDCIGKGAYGEVFRCIDINSQGTFGLKVIRDAEWSDP
jgi:hypothetical protein